MKRWPWYCNINNHGSTLPLSTTSVYYSRISIHDRMSVVLKCHVISSARLNTYNDANKHRESNVMLGDSTVTNCAALQEVDTEKKIIFSLLPREAA